MSERTDAPKTDQACASARCHSDSALSPHNHSTRQHDRLRISHWIQRLYPCTARRPQPIPPRLDEYTQANAHASRTATYDATPSSSLYESHPARFFENHPRRMSIRSTRATPRSARLYRFAHPTSRIDVDSLRCAAMHPRASTSKSHRNLPSKHDPNLLANRKTRAPPRSALL